MCRGAISEGRQREGVAGVGDGGGVGGAPEGTDGHV